MNQFTAREVQNRLSTNLEPAWIFPGELLGAYFDSCIKFGGVINGVLSRNVGTMRFDYALQQRCTIFWVSWPTSHLKLILLCSSHTSQAAVTTNLRITKES